MTVIISEPDIEDELKRIVINYLNRGGVVSERLYQKIYARPRPPFKTVEVVYVYPNEGQERD